MSEQVLSGDPISTPVMAPKEEPKEVSAEAKKPLYQGIAGSIDTQDQLLSYTKNIEEMLIATRAATMEKKDPEPQPFIQQTAQPTMQISQEEQLEKEIDDVWFSDSRKARALMDQRYELMRQKEKAQSEYQNNFWNEFYQQNPDLKDNSNAVQLILAAKNATVAQMKTKAEVAKFLADESRKIIEPIKNKYVSKETPLESQAAVSFGASGDPVVRPPTPDANQPKTLADQVLQLNAKRRQKK